MAEKSFVAGLQGYLEKNSGLMKAKAKFWCCLEGHIMELFKNDKRVFCIESMNLNDVQTVRKVNSDKTGTQFEIIMKKSKRHIFTAVDPNDCSRWIKELQNVMIAHPVADITRFDRLSVSDDGTYTSIDDLVSPGKDNSAKTVSDSINKAGATKSSSDYDYIEIQDFPLQPNANPNSKDDFSKTVSAYDDANVVIRKSKNVDLGSQYAEIDEVCSEATSERAVTEETHKDLYATINKKPKKSESVPEISDADLDAVFDCLDYTKPSPLIPLEGEDYKPLLEMKLFLDNNKDMCRYSYSILQPGEDPIEQMKVILKEIR